MFPVLVSNVKAGVMSFLKTLIYKLKNYKQQHSSNWQKTEERLWVQRFLPGRPMTWLRWRGQWATCRRRASTRSGPPRWRWNRRQTAASRTSGWASSQSSPPSSPPAGPRRLLPQSLWTEQQNIFHFQDTNCQPSTLGADVVPRTRRPGLHPTAIEGQQWQWVQGWRESCTPAQTRNSWDPELMQKWPGTASCCSLY